MDVALDLARDDLRLAVIVGGILDQAADQQRHVHHQSLHRPLRKSQVVKIMSLHDALALACKVAEGHATHTQKGWTRLHASLFQG